MPRAWSVAVSLRLGAVVEVNHAVAETALVQEFEVQADAVGEGDDRGFVGKGAEDVGGLIDEAALARALQDGRVAGAAMRWR